MAFRILSLPDWTGRWTCSPSLGILAKAWARSSRNPLGWGEVNRMRSRPSTAFTRSSSWTKGVTPSVCG